MANKKATIGLTDEEEEFLRKSNHKQKKETEVMIDVHGNAHKVVAHHSKDAAVHTHTPGATNFTSGSDRVNHRFETTNDVSYRGGGSAGGSRSRSNSPGRVPVRHRKSDSPARRGSGAADSPRDRVDSPGAKRSGGGI
jgi:hypothetical protein